MPGKCGYLPTSHAREQSTFILRVYVESSRSLIYILFNLNTAKEAHRCNGPYFLAFLLVILRETLGMALPADLPMSYTPELRLKRDSALTCIFTVLQINVLFFAWDTSYTMSLSGRKRNRYC